MIGTNEGLYKIEDYNKPQLIDEKPWKLEQQIIRSISIHNKTIWIGTEGNGLYKFDIKGNLLKHFIYSEKKQNSLHSNYVLYTFIDSNNNLWLGTWFGGIDLLNLDETNFNFIYDSKDEKKLFSNIIWTIEKLPDGRYFLGTHGNGLCVLKPNDVNFESLINTNELKSISSLYYDPITKLLYIGTWANGIKIYDTTLNTLVKEDKAFDPLKKERIYSIIQSLNDQLLIGTFDKGLFRYDLKNKELHKVQSSITSFNTTDVRSIILDKQKGEIWIGSLSNGLYHLKITSPDIIKVIGHYQNYDKTKQKISSRKLYLDANKDVWVLGESSIGKIKSGRKPEALPILNNGINSAITTDNKNNYWVGTYNGLYYLKSNTLNVSSSLANYSIYELLYNPSNNSLLAASNNGLIKVDLNQHPKNSHFPKIALSRLKILDQTILPNQSIKDKMVLHKKLNYNDTIILPHFAQTFSIDINALSFINSKKIQLRYKLLGFESLWNETSNISTTASYTNVPPGEYTLTVQVANEDGIWSTETKQLSIIKLKPWWATHLAYILYVLTAIAIIYWISNILYSRTLIAQQLRIEKLEKEQEHELHQQKLSFFTNISHDLRSPLTLIISPLEELITNGRTDEHLRAKLSRMLKNARMLLNLVNQILDFRKAETNNLKLDLKQIDIKAFIQSIYYQFHELAQNKSIDLEVFYPDEDIVLAADPNKLESIFFNLLSNAIKFTPKYGHIFITISNEGNMVFVSVKDTGIGIPDNEKEFIFTRFYQSKKNAHLHGTGIGLALAKKYMEAHNGTIEVKSIENRGTEFIVGLPILKDAHLYDSYIINEDIEAVLGAKSSIEIENNQKPYSIVIIDDNDDIREYLKEILQENYQVFTAENGKKGLSIINKKTPSLVISDIMMEEMNGLEVCEHIKTNVNTSHIPVILLTAKNTMESKIEGFEKGGDAYIEKPFNSKLLLTRVKTLIQERALLKNKFLLTNTVSNETIPSSDDKDFIEKIISKIEAHISEPDFSVQSLTEIVHMSQDQLYRKIKALTGLSINHFIRLMRVKKAARLLKEGRFSVSEILYMVGFNNASYFTKCFKAEFGVTPSEYSRERGNSISN